MYKRLQKYKKCVILNFKKNDRISQKDHPNHNSFKKLRKHLELILNSLICLFTSQFSIIYNHAKEIVIFFLIIKHNLKFELFINV